MALKDIELKDTCDKRQFVDMLQQWLQSIEKGEDFDVRVAGHSCSIPAKALDKGRFRVEYEIDHGEHEFELTLKWR